MSLKFHHINLVSKNLSELNDFYVNVLGLNSLSSKKFQRTKSTEKEGYSGAIKFVTDGNIQMHLAEKDLTIAAKNGFFLNPVEKGHIAFRTKNIETFIKVLKKNNIQFADYGYSFSREWYQIFFYDPEGNIVEVHQEKLS